MKLIRRHLDILGQARSSADGFVFAKLNATVLALCNAGYLEERANAPQTGKKGSALLVLTPFGKQALVAAEQAQIEKAEDARRTREHRELKRREREANQCWGFCR